MASYKKGNIMDIPLIGILVFVAAIVFIIAFMVLSTINTGLEETGTFDNSSLEIIQKQVNIFPTIWDRGLMFVLVGLSIFTWISAFFVRSHPAFFIFGFLIIVIFTVVFGLMSNTFAEVTEDPSISEFADEFTITKFMMNRFPLIMIVLSFITAVIVYSKGGEPSF